MLEELIFTARKFQYSYKINKLRNVFVSACEHSWKLELLFCWRISVGLCAQLMKGELWNSLHINTLPELLETHTDIFSLHCGMRVVEEISHGYPMMLSLIFTITLVELCIYDNLLWKLTTIIKVHIVCIWLDKSDVRVSFY